MTIFLMLKKQGSAEGSTMLSIMEQQELDRTSSSVASAKLMLALESEGGRENHEEGYSLFFALEYQYY